MHKYEEILKASSPFKKNNKLHDNMQLKDDPHNNPLQHSEQKYDNFLSNL